MCFEQGANGRSGRRARARPRGPSGPQRPTGAELAKATGWQPHSVRGVLTATIKKRLNLPLVSAKGEDGVRRYHIAVLREDGAIG